MVIAVLAIPGITLAATSANVPVASRVYSDLERLEIKGLLPTSMLSTRPINRVEAARLISEARGLHREKANSSYATWRLIERLSRRFDEEFKQNTGRSYFKPFDTIYIRGAYSEGAPRFIDVNNDGDEHRQGGNMRVGISMRANLFGHVVAHTAPEYRLGDGFSRGKLRYGYVKLGFLGLELQGGAESMWWGPGYHGSLLLANNAEPLDAVRLTTSRPVLMPWIFRPLGLMKPTVFLARLENNRTVPSANILGMRLDFKPTPSLQFGLTRVFMFGGEGRASLSFSDWIKIFTIQDSAEHSNSPINGNQIVSVDLSYVYVSDWKYLPFLGIKIYTEWGAEDSSGKTKSPTGKADVIGAFVDEPFWLGDVDLRVEWANTARNARYGPSWYRHAVYRTGYTHSGRFIGHHIGGDSRGLFFKGRKHFDCGSFLAIEAERVRSGIHGNKEPTRFWYAVESFVPLPWFNVAAKAGLDRVSGGDADLNVILQLDLVF